MSGALAPLLPKRHKPKVQHQPDRHRKNGNRDQTIPRPLQCLRLHGVDGDHEIVAEARMAEERAILRIFSANSAEKCERSKRQNHKRQE